MRAFTLAHAELSIATPSATSTTRRGIDQITDLILTDRGLRFEIPSDQIVDGARAANSISLLITEGVRTLRLDACKTACKSFQIPWVNSVQKFPPRVM